MIECSYLGCGNEATHYVRSRASSPVCADCGGPDAMPIPEGASA